MRNINPSLIHGQALAWADKQCPDMVDRPRQRDRVDVRVYETSGSGYFFVQGISPGKWYYRSSADADHFTNCEVSQVQEAIDAGGRVQIVGDYRKSLGVWPDWETFAKDVLA